MAQAKLRTDKEVVIAEEVGHVAILTLNRPNQLNIISREVALLLGQNLEKFEKDDNAEFLIIKGAGRAFSAGGDLRMLYDGRKTRDSCVEVNYRMHWLCYHIHTCKKPQVALVHGLCMGASASLMVPMRFSVVTEKSYFATPETRLGYHPDCGISYIFSRLPGRLGEFLGLTGVKLKGKEVVAAGLATHFVPSHKLVHLEKRLLSLNTGEETAIRSAIDEFSTEVQINKRSILNKLPIINECFSKDSMEEIMTSLEVEARKIGNNWIIPVLEGLKKSSPTGLKITLRSVILHPCQINLSYTEHYDDQTVENSYHLHKHNLLCDTNLLIYQVTNYLSQRFNRDYIINSLSTKGGGKVCVHLTLPRPHV